jgi:hypothetical protein
MSHTRINFPRQVREIENTWITLRDSVRLAARIWLPTNAEQEPVPAILEYLPYRKDDCTAQGDALWHPYFAGHGYASVRVDIRGSGDSDGLLLDEYLKQEQDDALEVLAWIAAQPWCTGAIGMYGISWGGFNGLQVAARRPPQLKCIITLCSTDDRYTDDCHYMGGALLGSDMIKWASMMFAYNAQPPDPKHVGERWREMWLNRLRNAPPFLEAWMSHPRCDAYWKHGSVIEDYSAIACAVYAVGGWADPYTNAIPRLLQGLTAPRKGLIGPWSHMRPHDALPGPSIGFLHECLRWWDHWLKGMDTGIMREPMLCAWMQDSPPPATHYAEWPGHWVAEAAWPSENVRMLAMRLDGAALDSVSPTPNPSPSGRGDSVSPPAQREGQGVGSRRAISSVQQCGMNAGTWCPYGIPGDMPGDQRMDDGWSLCYDAAPATEPQQTLGFPELALTLSVDKPLAQIAVRLCDVAPSGSSLLVSWALLNLTHREGHEDLKPMPVNEPVTVTLKLNAIAHQLPTGHCWRLAVSPTYWPHLWPSPEPVTLTIHGGELRLPIRAPRAEDAALPEFDRPETAAPLEVEVLHETPRRRTHSISADAPPARFHLEDHFSEGAFRIARDGLTYETDYCDAFDIVEGDPLSAFITCTRDIRIGRGEWRTRIATTSTLSSTAETFTITNVLDAYEGETRIHSTTRTLTLPRDHA